MNSLLKRGKQNKIIEFGIWANLLELVSTICKIAHSIGVKNILE